MPLFLAPSPYFSSEKNLESGVASGRRVRLLGSMTRKEEAQRERKGSGKRRKVLQGDK